MFDAITKNDINKHLTYNLPIYLFNEIDSTNTYAKSITDSSALIVADFQTNGRGRLGRQFFSPKGAGIYMSLKIKVANHYQMVPFITTLTATAVAEAIENLFNISLQIKWVNDIYLNNKKLSGILCESLPDGSVIIGIGINFYQSSVPDELRDIIAFLPKSDNTRSRLIGEIVNNIMNYISRLPQTDFMEYYKSHSLVIGKTLTCIQGDNSFTAKGHAITDEGFLVVETHEGLKTLSTGDVTIRFM